MVTESVGFVGRERERAHLRAALDAAARGQGGVTLVAGEAGIGKTRLLYEVASEARAAGWQVIAGRAYETEGAPPYLPFLEALREHVRSCTAAMLCPHLGDGTVALMSLPIESDHPGSTDPAELRPPWERYAFFERVTDGLLAIAGTGCREPGAGEVVTPLTPNYSHTAPGLALVLDDLQWADAPSLRLLLHLRWRLADVPLLVLGAYRTPAPELPHPFADALAELTRDGLLERLVLTPLEREETAALVEALSGQRASQPTINEIQHETGGNPLFVREFVHDLAADGRDLADPRAMAGRQRVPEGVRHVIGKRLLRLRPEAAGLLRAGAVLGDGWTFGELAAMSESAEPAVLVALEEALGAGILREEDGDFYFTHPLIRRTIYDDISHPRRQRLHRRAAEAIEAVHAGRLGPHLARVAAHYRLAGDAPEPAFDYARRAGDRALALYAYEEAARLYQSALDTLDLEGDAAVPAGKGGWQAGRCDLLLALGAALLPAGGIDRVLEEVAPAAFDLAVDLADRPRASRACRLALEALHRRPNHDMGAAPRWILWVERAERYAQAQTVERVLADVHRARGPVTWEGWQECWGLLSRALALARRLDDPETLFRTALEIIQIPWQPRLQAERRRLVEEFLGRDRSGVSVRTLALLLWHSGRVLFDWGERARTESLWREVEELGRRTGDADILLWPRISRPFLLLADGRLTEALAAAEQAAADPGLTAPTARAFSLPVISRCSDYFGDAERKRAQVDETERLAGGELYWFAYARANVYAQSGRRDEARALIRKVLTRRDMRRANEHTSAGNLMTVLEAAILVEDRAAAAVLAPSLGELAGLARCDWNFPCVARLLGGALALAREWDAARAHYEQALAVTARARYRPEQALTHLELARLLIERFPDERARAREHLETAIAQFSEMEMQPALEQGLALRADEFDQAPSRRRRTYPDRLTAREVEVLRLIAAGRSNREIGADLVLSVRTVERHITNIYTKIGARARADATVYAISHGLAPDLVPT
jgi:DNA-binding CsgD family transcriptional regulator